MAKNDSIEMLQSKIKLLNMAKRRLENGKNFWVCIALLISAEKHPRLYNAHRSLCDYISKVLGKHSLLSDWVRANRKKFPVRDMNDARKYRIQWVDWMISSLEEDLALKSGNR